jgi:TPR repeat protein
LGLLFLTPLPFSYITPRLKQPLPLFKSHAFWKNLGKDVKQDDFKAVKFYQKACGLNDENTMIKAIQHIQALSQFKQNALNQKLSKA